MKYYLFFAALLTTLLISNTGTAITITTTPDPANIGQQISVSIRSTWTGPDLCEMQINFGDGSGWQPTGLCDHITVCNQSATHTYSTSGSFTVTARSHPDPGQCIVPPTAPDPATYQIVIRDPIALQEEKLPTGVVGMDYKYQFTAQGGSGQLRYRLVAGAFPPGLRLSTRGEITGVPIRKGRYAMRLQITDQGGQSLERRYVLTFEQASLTVQVSPTQQTTPGNRAATFNLNYTFTSTELLNDTLRSSRGRFIAGNQPSMNSNSGRTLGYFNKNITVTMQRGQARASEMVTLPLSILQMAQRLGLQQIRYERTFKADYMDAETTGSSVIAVGTEFTVTGMHLYFGNNEGKITLKRDQRDVEVFVDITYEGVGFLKGFWEADGRILAVVQKNLVYSREKTITLTYPRVPPLPTYSYGSHRLRFVISQPQMDVVFPEAIYMVEGEGLAEQHPILLLKPGDGMGLSRSEPLFAWQEKRGVKTYIVQFFSDKDEAPFFSTYTRENSYRVPSSLLDKFFTGSGRYWWLVSGYNKEEEVVAQSRRHSFTMAR